MLNVLHMPNFFLAHGFFFSSEIICKADVNTQKRQAKNIAMKLEVSYKGIEYLRVEFRIIAQ